MMNKRVVIIVQARMGSTRLPGKILKKVLGKPLLSYLIERLRQAKQAHDIVIATTLNPQDEAIVELSQNERVSFMRGSEEDVLKRTLEAADLFQADIIVRITSDCPLIDPDLIDRAILAFSDCDYLRLEKFPRGLDVEVFSTQSLKEAHREAKEAREREHVTLFIREHPEQYRLKTLENDQDASIHRWTVDTPEDFELVSKMIEALYPTSPNFHLNDMLRLLEKHPEWSKINASIQQKHV